MEKGLRELQERHAADLREYVARQEFLRPLPESVPVPVVSNISKDGMRAWLSFGTFRPTAKEPGSVILTALEAAGYKAEPVSLTWWDNYRPAPNYGLQDDIPETREGSYGNTGKELRRVDALAPLWLDCGSHQDCTAHAFYRAPDGRLCRVAVIGPATFSAHARRIESRGGWHYEQGSGRIHYPESWKRVALDEATVATIHPTSRAYVETEQSVRGVLYLENQVPQDDFPLSPAELLARLEG